MAATTDQLIALGNDGGFRQRCRALIRQYCGQVEAEGSGVANHASRLSLALKLATGLSSPDPIIDYLLTRTNLIGSTVSLTVLSGGQVQVTTDASDAAILSQLNTDWDFLSGVAV